jgi:hypothetical protein
MARIIKFLSSNDKTQLSAKGWSSVARSSGRISAVMAIT